MEQEVSNSEDRVYLSLEKILGKYIPIFRPYLKRLWENRKLYLILNASFAVAVVIYLLLTVKAVYEVTITVLPDFGGQPTLTQLSVLLGSGGGSSMEIYQNLLGSEAILEQVILTKYRTEKFQDSVDLIRYFDLGGNSDYPADEQSRITFLKTLERVRGLFTVDVDLTTKILELKVVTPESRLSADIANKAIESLNEYLNTKRKSKATYQSFYLEKRLSDIRDSLRGAEDDLRDFHTRNRAIAQSPELVMEERALLRAAEIFQSLYIELAKQLELMKIEEIREAPVVNLREVARDPVIRFYPKRRFRFVLWVGMFFVFTTAYITLKPELFSTYEFLKRSLR